MTPTIEDLVTLDLGVGAVTGAEPNTGVRDPGHRLWPLGGSHRRRRSSADLQRKLCGRGRVVAVTAFDPDGGVLIARAQGSCRIADRVRLR